MNASLHRARCCLAIAHRRRSSGCTPARRWFASAASSSSSSSRTSSSSSRPILIDTDSDSDDEVVYDTIPADISQLVSDHCVKPPTNVSLQMLMKTGRGELLGKSYKTEAFMGRMGQRLATERILIQNAAFLRKEIPIRLAHRIMDLDRVPVLRDMRAVQDVKSIYIESFLEMLEHPAIHTQEEEESFASMLAKLYTKHSSVLVMMAKGAYELREAVRAGEVSMDEHGSDGGVGGGDGDSDEAGAAASPVRTPTISKPRVLRSLLDLPSPKTTSTTTSVRSQLADASFEQMYDSQQFLDRFYMSRIGIRVLAGQYLALRDRPLPNYVGMICQTTSPSDIVRKAARDAMGICRRKYGRSPAVNLTGRLDLTFPYIPTYLHYILLELLKNALRATAEHHLPASQKEYHSSNIGKNPTPLPPVTVIIADGDDNEDVVVKIADKGGGIPRSRMEKIWSYLYTTADPALQQAIFYGRDHSNVSPIAGLGYGLPISRSYCRYFGGDIDIMSMDGYGTDVFVYMKRLGDSKEPVLV